MTHDFGDLVIERLDGKLATICIPCFTSIRSQEIVWRLDLYFPSADHIRRARESAPPSNGMPIIREIRGSEIVLNAHVDQEETS